MSEKDHEGCAMQKAEWYLTFSASVAGNDWIHANPVAHAA